MLEPRPLKGKVALITGSTGGVGLALAQGLARAGSDVVLHGLESKEVMRDQRKALERDHGVCASYVRADLTKPGEIDLLMSETTQRYGAVDILVNNAVTRTFAPIISFPVDSWDNALAINVSAPFHLIRLALPAMLDRGWGRIFNMTSVYASRGAVNRIDYVTSKHALVGITRAVALETLSQGVTCNAICPGSVLTPNTDTRVRALMQDGSLDRHQATREFLAGKQPIGRFVEAAHIAELVVFLCGEAGRDITGVTLPIEGGWLAS